MVMFRNGFVSNSSSSSFLIYGTMFPEHSNDEIDVIEELESMDTDLEMHVMGMEGLVFLGKCPTTIPNDMTMGDWKEKVEQEVNRVTKQLGVEDDMEKTTWFQECWFDG